MASEDTQVILSAMKEQGQRHEKAFGDLASEIRDMSAAIVKGFAQSRGVTPTGVNGKGLLFGVAAIVFGLMAPMYIMVKSVSDAVVDHQGLVAHPVATEHLAKLSEQLKEVETQFAGVREVMSIRSENNKEHVAEIRSWFGAPPLKVDGDVAPRR